MTLPEPPLSFAALDHRREKGRIFGIRPADLARHVYVIGKSGSGKTALLERFLVGLIRRGYGCGLIDPHGDLAERLLDFIPRHRTNDVVLFDPSDIEHPVGMNPINHVEPDARPLVASGVIAAFRKVFAEHWGPRLEHVFRQTLLALLDARGTTLLGALRMLVDDDYRASIVRQVQDPLVRFYWTREFAAYPKPFVAEVIAPVQNKLGAVLSTPMLRNILGQPSSTFSCREVMDEGCIFIANLAKGKLGEDASALLGALLVTAFQSATYARADVAPEARRPFVLMVDEFTSIATRSFGELLAEARKYGLSLVLAHQHLEQLDDLLRASLLGNAGTLIAFQLGAADAEVLEREFAPELSASDLTRLARHQIALRLAVDGRTSLPFTAVTLPPHADAERVGQAEVIRRASRERYGRPREKVQRQIEAQLCR